MLLVVAHESRRESKRVVEGEGARVEVLLGLCEETCCGEGNQSKTYTL